MSACIYCDRQAAFRLPGGNYCPRHGMDEFPELIRDTVKLYGLHRLRLSSSTT